MSDAVADRHAESEVSPLVSPAWLAAREPGKDLLVVDIRSAVDGGGRDAYEQGHIPGAVHTDYVRDGWRATRGSATGLLPEEAQLAALLGRIGLTSEQHAVIVPAGTSAGDFSAAARVYWTLKVAGHRRISILDGGMAGWRADPARRVVTGPSPTPAAAEPYPLRPAAAALRADVARVERAVKDGSAMLIDTRATGYFEGREKSPQAARGGRLPGACHLDHVAAYDPVGQKLRPRADLERLYAGVPATTTIHYCNTGHQAATSWFVVSEVLGRPDTLLYDGSMSEWTEDSERPVATGP